MSLSYRLLVLGLPVVLPGAEVLAAGSVACLEPVGKAVTALSVSFGEETGDPHIAVAGRDVHEPILVVTKTAAESLAVGKSVAHLHLHAHPRGPSSQALHGGEVVTQVHQSVPFRLTRAHGHDMPSGPLPSSGP